MKTSENLFLLKSKVENEGASDQKIKSILVPSYGAIHDEYQPRPSITRDLELPFPKERQASLPPARFSLNNGLNAQPAPVADFEVAQNFIRNIDVNSFQNQQGQIDFSDAAIAQKKFGPNPG